MSTNSVTVAVRCRPFNQREIDEGAMCIIDMKGTSTTIAVGDKSHTFVFDHSFWSFDTSDANHHSQEDVFNAIGTSVLDSAMEGYNSCLFAYGQTGSGKTYTMLGYGGDVGVIPRLCRSLFDTCNAKKEEKAGDWDYRIQVSYLEIYNEKCRCLLNPGSKEVKPREHPITGPYVEGLAEVIVSTYEEIDQLMDEGNKTRTVACTQMNATSSRSHAIFTLTFTQLSGISSDPKGKGNEKVSKINLVDLAGSERADKTGATGATLKEGANINKSLVCLGKVIAALADASGEGDKKKKHIPFRDSTLTWLLKENLGGNSKTFMLAALSPHVTNYEESLSTLRYADRAKRIKTHAVVNEDPTSRRIRELSEEVMRLKALLEAGVLPQSPPPGQPASDNKTELRESSNTTTVQADDSRPASPSSPDKEQQADYSQLPAAEQLTITLQALQEASTSWEEKEKQNEIVKAERTEALHALGIGVNIDKSMPALVNLNEDPFMSECLMYYLKEGTTRVGSEVTKNEEETNENVVLGGATIQPHHCTIEVGVAAEGGSPDDDFVKITVEGTAVVLVNGVPITTERLLAPRDRIIVGEDGHVFRLAFPKKETGQGGQGGEVVDYQMAVKEKYDKEAENFKKAILEEVNKEEVKREEKVLETERRARDEGLRRREAEARIKELEENLKAAPVLPGGAKAPQQSKLAPAGVAAPQKGALYTSAGGRIKHVDVGLFSANRKQVARVPPQLVRKYKLILVGHEEAGKTSLKKCWQGDPLFFKKLPEVMCTTGIEVQEHRLRYEGFGAGSKDDDELTLQVLDFAGQEVYHSHSLFLTPRTIFVFVWKMSNYEDGEMSAEEEARMMNWLDEVYSKAPGCSAVIIGTHKDELPNQSLSYVNTVLNNVKHRFEDYVKSIRISEEPNQSINIAGSYAVSSKTRQAWGGKFQTPKGVKMSELLRAIGELAFRLCIDDRTFPAGAIPGRHVQFWKELERIKKEKKKLLLPIQEYAQLAADFGIEDQRELCDCTNLLHCWNVIYLFTQAKRLLDNPYIFLHPIWLSHMVSALFSYAHVIYTPPEMRRYIGGLDFNAVDALKADRGGIRQGEINLDLLRVCLEKSIKNIRNEPRSVPLDTAEIEMCLQLLISMDLVFQRVLPDSAGEDPLQATTSLHDTDKLSSISSASKFYVPCLFPYPCPPVLKDVVPYLFQKGVGRMYLFNIFPKEFYFRLVCRLHHLLIPLSVAVESGLAPDIGTDSKYLPSNYSFELRDHWKDGMWIGTDSIRAFIYRDDTMIYTYFLPECAMPDLPSSDEERVNLTEFVAYVDEVIRTLADEYDGLSVSCCQPCIEPECENWFDVAVLREVAGRDGTIQCQGCQEDRRAVELLAGGGLEVGPGESWGEMWPNMTAALSNDAASALLVALGCVINESDVQDAGEAHLCSEPHKVPEWLDKFVKVVMYIHFSQMASCD
ncbi:Kinesin-like protein unc-104 [Diplonema papillatum]|nr:Kinesin-like protein unc-104 [Diplonema papillatum]